MKAFGKPRETRGASPWKDKPQYIGRDGRLWWQEPCGAWWCEDDAEDINSLDELDERTGKKLPSWGRLIKYMARK